MLNRIRVARGRARPGTGLAWVIAAMVCAALLAPTAIYAAIGEVIVLKGEVSLIRGRIQARVQERFELEDGDRVVTGSGAKALIRLTGGMAGTEAVVTEKTEFKVNELLARRNTSPLELVLGAIRSRVVKYTGREPFMRTPVAVIGIKGTDFIVYVKRKEASEFIGVDGLIQAASASRPDYKILIGKREWGEIVEGQPPRPPIPVPDELWNPALEEFRFPTPEEIGTATRRGQ